MIKNLFALSVTILTSLCFSNAFGKPPCDVTSAVSEWTDCVGESFGKDGFFYRGEFLDGKPSGLGEERITSHRWHKGEFLNDRFHGLGARFDVVAGSITIGRWVEGKLTVGFVTSPHGNYFGKWKNQKFDGEGIWVSSDNQISFGLWQDGNLIEDYLSEESSKHCGDNNSLNNCAAKLGTDEEMVVGFFENAICRVWDILKTNRDMFFGFHTDSKLVGNALMISNQDHLFW